MCRSRDVNARQFVTRSSDMAGALGVPVYRAAATGFMVALNETRESARPLTELQAIDVLTCLMQSLDGLRDQLCGSLEADRVLRQFVDEGGEIT